MVTQVTQVTQIIMALKKPSNFKGFRVVELCNLLCNLFRKRLHKMPSGLFSAGHPARLGPQNGSGSSTSMTS